jgi:phytoene/squalene synthetase
VSSAAGGTGGESTGLGYAELATHARTFHFASRFLPRRNRDAAAVVYAVCRAIDDAVDEAPGPDAALAALDGLRAELAGRACARPLIGAFLRVASERRLPLEAVTELIAGVAGDVGPVTMPDDRSLLRYCYRVAGTVGLLMCGVLDVDAEAAAPHAIDLGIGMQLTNICRDVLEDGLRDRVYLPASRLAAAGASARTGAGEPGIDRDAVIGAARQVSAAAALRRGESTGDAPGAGAALGDVDSWARNRARAVEPADADVAHPVVREAVRAVTADLLRVDAERYYASGAAGLRWIPRRPRRAITVAAVAYRAIGRRQLRRRNGDPLPGRTSISARGKAALALAALLRPTPRRRAHDPELHRALAGLPGANPPPDAGDGR